MVEEEGEGEAVPHLIDFHARSVKHTKPIAIINNMLKTFNC